MCVCVCGKGNIMRTGLPYTRLGFRLNELALTVTEAQKALSAGGLLQALEGEENEILQEDFAEMAGAFYGRLGGGVERPPRFCGGNKKIKTLAAPAVHAPEPPRP